MTEQRERISPSLKAETMDGGYLQVKSMSGKTVAIDVAMGLMAPIVVSPLIAVVDASIIIGTFDTSKGVMQHLRGNYALLFTKPGTFFRTPFWRQMCVLCWMVYGGTYAGSNLATSYNQSNNRTDDEGKMLKLTVSAGANIGLTLVKDILMVGIIAEYVKTLSPEARANAAGRGERKMNVPYRSRGCFLIRDALTMVAAFYLADRLGRWISDTSGMDKRTSRQVANLGLPTALQPASTVFHLYGLNFAKTPDATTSAIAGSMSAAYFSSVAARMARILPAVGLGNNFNNELRDSAYRYAERTSFL